MKIGLVIVDSWVSNKWSNFLCKKYGENPVPDWSDTEKKNVRQFSKFLTYVCDFERRRGTTIIHSFGEKTTKFIQHANINSISQVKIKTGDLVVGADLIAEAIIIEKLNFVLYGGFHFGKCVHGHCEIAQLNLDLNNKSNVDNLNIALNLSMVLPKNSFKQNLAKTSKRLLKPYFSSYNYHLWSLDGFESLLVYKDTQ